MLLYINLQVIETMKLLVKRRNKISIVIPIDIYYYYSLASFPVKTIYYSIFVMTNFFYLFENDNNLCIHYTIFSIINFINCKILNATLLI